MSQNHPSNLQLQPFRSSEMEKALLSVRLRVVVELRTMTPRRKTWEPVVNSASNAIVSKFLTSRELMSLQWMGSPSTRSLIRLRLTGPTDTSRRGTRTPSQNISRASDSQLVSLQPTLVTTGRCSAMQSDTIGAKEMRDNCKPADNPTQFDCTCAHQM